MKKHVKVRVFGKVQGFWFRKGVKEQADSFGIRGFVMNMSDGSVYIEAEGEEVDLEKLIMWCQRGSGGARVEKVEQVFNNKLKKYEEFSIRK